MQQCLKSIFIPKIDATMSQIYFYSKNKNKFEKLLHLFGFIIRIYAVNFCHHLAVLLANNNYPHLSITITCYRRVINE